MIKKNNLRKIYLAYVISLVEIFCVAIILCARNFTEGTLQALLQIAAAAGMVIAPAAMLLLYRILKKDNASSSDEREQYVLLKSAAFTGILSLSALPVLLLLTCLFPLAAVYCVFGYTALVAGGFKLSTFYYYRKY